MAYLWRAAGIIHERIQIQFVISAGHLGVYITHTYTHTYTLLFRETHARHRERFLLNFS